MLSSLLYWPDIINNVFNERPSFSDQGVDGPDLQTNGLFRLQSTQAHAGSRQLTLTGDFTR